MSTSTFAGLLSLKKVFFLEMFITALLYLLHLLLLLLPLLLWYFLQVRMKKTLQLPRGRSHLRHAWTPTTTSGDPPCSRASDSRGDPTTAVCRRLSTTPACRKTRQAPAARIPTTITQCRVSEVKKKDAQIHHTAFVSPCQGSADRTHSHTQTMVSTPLSKWVVALRNTLLVRYHQNTFLGFFFFCVFFSIRAAKTATTRFSQIPRTARLSNRTAGTGRHLHSLFAKKGDYFEKSNPTRPEQHAQQPECLVRSRPPPLMPLRLPGAHDEMAMMYSSRV
uniref:Transmembrane protein n=1 Tax=Mesocestoides corti TaxID=53468 RepID=A0A5K3EKU2_MESCO